MDGFWTTAPPWPVSVARTEVAVTCAGMGIATGVQGLRAGARYDAGSTGHPDGHRARREDASGRLMDAAEANRDGAIRRPGGTAPGSGPVLVGHSGQHDRQKYDSRASFAEIVQPPGKATRSEVCRRPDGAMPTFADAKHRPAAVPVFVTRVATVQATGGRERSVTMTADGQPMTSPCLGGAVAARRLEGDAFGWRVLVARFDPAGSRPFAYAILGRHGIDPTGDASGVRARQGSGCAASMGGCGAAADTFEFRSHPRT